MVVMSSSPTIQADKSYEIGTDQPFTEEGSAFGYGGEGWRAEETTDCELMQAIEQTSPSASVVKAAIPVDAEDASKVKAKEFATIMSEIDKLISDVVAEKSMAVVPDKGKKIEDVLLEKKDFDLRHLGGQELSKEDKSELKEFAMSCGYQPYSSVGSMKKSWDAFATAPGRRL
jgi:hypothetical protein